MELIFATNNRHKVEEIQSAIGNKITIRTLSDAGIDIDIPEPFDTLEANALQKSRTIFELTGSDCFSEDTGLEVESLNGQPGVKSARYAGDEKDFQKNIDKLLKELAHTDNRRARFRTVISLIWEGEEYSFDGICSGTIIHGQRGNYGFGYDSIFVPNGSENTFAEMNMEEKNQFSHRKKAADKLVSFLQNIPSTRSKI
jgi:XTP/dITP diphosphohydrolase